MQDQSELPVLAYSGSGKHSIEQDLVAFKYKVGINWVSASTLI